MHSKHTALVLLSGGLDSSVLLHHVHQSNNYGSIQALGYNYGQRHLRELDCAHAQVDMLPQGRLKILDISFMGGLLAEGTSLVSEGAEVPDLESLSEDDLVQPPTYVPNRNMMLLSIAAAYAEAEGIRDIYYGAQAHDEYGYWDCTEEFLTLINAVLSLNRKDAITVHAPFVGMKKNELVTRGLELGVNFARTWSCYRGGENPCETCPTCVERSNAFRDAGESDPLLKF
jgi:7-cyano-7-deazaguanine synthase